VINNLIIKFGAHPWNPRGKHRLYRILAGSSWMVEGVTPQGIKLRFRPDDATCFLFFRPGYQTQLTDLIAALPPGGVFVDVGANVGNYSLLGARQVGASGLVVSFEPVAKTYSGFLQNISANHVPNVVPFNAAAAAEEGMAEMVCSEDSGLSHVGRVEGVARTPTQRTAMLTLNRTLPPLLGGRAIDLMKVDVEGAELGVLRGASQLLETGRIKRLLVEIAPACLARFKTTPAELTDFLAARGYRMRPPASGVVADDALFERD
jgi:FkbM family methyltransferase